MQATSPDGTDMKSTYCDIKTRSMVDLDCWRRPEGWTICRVSVLRPHRRQGIATRLMREVLADADKEGVRLFLEPIPSLDGGPDRDQLIVWYESFGFRPYRPELGFTWQRLPVTTESA
jgi:GNAT superfamily N-acetyltransferase